jgi:predicted amidophosphoribosyltransferase
MNLGPTEDIFALRSLGESTWAKAFLNKEMVITNWRKLIDKFCDNCGAALAKDEETCPKCGTRYRPQGTRTRSENS